MALEAYKFKDFSTGRNVLPRSTQRHRNNYCLPWKLNIIGSKQRATSNMPKGVSDPYFRLASSYRTTWCIYCGCTRGKRERSDRGWCFKTFCFYLQRILPGKVQEMIHLHVYICEACSNWRSDIFELMFSFWWGLLLVLFNTSDTTNINHWIIRLLCLMNFPRFEYRTVHYLF